MSADLNASTLAVRQTGKTTGKFLLFIRSGKTLPLCLQHYQAHADIVVVLSLYQEATFTLDSECWITEGGLSKFDAARLFLARYPEMSDFEAYAFFDPDIEIAFSDIHALFRAGCRDGKAIYQPAVSADSHTHWDFLRLRQTGGWREVSFVEVMAPFFSRQALALVLDGFSASISTWGLEYAWYARCKHLSMAVSDRISMQHRSEVDLADGPFYRYLASLGVDPALEMKTLRQASVGKRFLECEIPRWVPLRLKPHFVRLSSEIALQKNYFPRRPLVRKLAALMAKK